MIRETNAADGAKSTVPGKSKPWSDDFEKFGHRAENHLNFQFALLSAAGGLVLASGQGMQDIAVIAVISAVFGFVFVDWLRIAYLPPLGAYVAMGAAALYCVSDFWDMPQRSDQQMVSVAMLLVLVQAVLMSQRKNRRIFEQLGVFCLLELVVAAIFNDAINYGMLLIPIGLVGGWAFSLLGITSAMEDVASAPRGVHRSVRDSNAKREDRESARSGELLTQKESGKVQRPWIARWLLAPLGPTDQITPSIQSWSPQSIDSMVAASRRWPRYAVLTLSPAVLVVSFVYFYALPRKVEANRTPGGGKTLVGFDDQIRLEQLGHMMQSSDTALRLRLTNQVTGEPYRVTQGMYLRGRVLEKYSVDWSNQVATWSALEDDTNRGTEILPIEYVPSSREKNLYDSVTVAVSCEAMSRSALFAIAPYHRSGNQRVVTHWEDRWTLSRRESEGSFDRIEYRFGTNAFFRGLQTNWIEAPDRDNAIFGPYSRRGFRGRRGKLDVAIAAELTKFESTRMPNLRQLALQLLDQIPDRKRTTYEIAKAFEKHLRDDPRYSYTLNLDAEPVSGMDPIEQFVSLDRRGHCQYFGSALAMMLRCVGIPSRMVVGYRTDEYSDLGEYYIARQRHAHAWVEALVERSELPNGLAINGQRKRDRYWLRLDPTPGQGGIPNQRDEQVDTVIDFAKNVWKEYVVEMDKERQKESFGDSLLTSDSVANGNWLLKLKQSLTNLAMRRPPADGERVGNALREAAPFVIGFFVLAVVLYGGHRGSWWARLTNRSSKGKSLDPLKTSHEFYSLALQQLQQIGVVRRPDETPEELLRRTKNELSDEAIIGPLKVLTDHFIRCCYGGRAATVDAGTVDSNLETLRQAVTRKVSGRENEGRD